MAKSKHSYGERRLENVMKVEQQKSAGSTDVQRQNLPYLRRLEIEASSSDKVGLELHLGPMLHENFR